MNQEKLQLCPRCSVGFFCDIAKGEENCWCFALSTLSKTNTEAKACYCPNCLKELLKEEKVNRTKK